MHKKTKQQTGMAVSLWFSFGLTRELACDG